MAEPDPAAAPASGPSNLILRIASSAVLAPVAIVVAWLGGRVFVLFWTVSACIVLWEWTMLVRGAHVSVPAFVAWMLAGLAYASILLLGPVTLRGDAALGLVAILFLFAIVWGTDVAAYFAGRALGGPKLWPAVSPKKTWSGAIGGTLGGIAAGLAVLAVAGVTLSPPVVTVALALSVASQGGDLLESAIKRRFGAKDASQLIPGHGGLMDRLDGFLTAVLAAVMVGLIRGGLDGPARGLLVW